MLAQPILKTVSKELSSAGRRNIGISAVLLQKASDPIQQLFLDKLKEYKSKSGGKLYDPSPEIQKEYKAELARIAQQYGGVKPEEMTKFPKFTFQDPEIKT
nr:PREDICTED: ATP synthase-coupling factor 6, mitochondrial [Bemisia tabaci]